MTVEVYTPDRETRADACYPNAYRYSAGECYCDTVPRCASDGGTADC